MSDPHYDREAEKYESPIPSREHILSFIQEKPRSKRQLFDLLALADEQKKAFERRLRAMVRDKQLSCNKSGVYRPFSNRGLLTGTVIANPKGFGFVALDKGGKDLRLTSQQMKLVFHGDKIRVRLLNKKLDAEIVEVLETVKTLVGRLHLDGKKPYVVVDDRRIKHNIEITELIDGCLDNQVVVVEMLSSPTIDSDAKGKISSIIGNYLDEGVEVDSAIYRHQIPAVFSEKALKESAQLPTKVIPKDKKNRIDITKLELITIDGEDSRDFDDAVYAEPTKNGWKLLVAIADVSHYVKEGSELDSESHERGNSVYFPHRVVPMLPEAISNGLCSLNPKVERLSMVCEMYIDPLGELLDYKFYSAVMLSHARLTYTQVNEMLEDKKSPLRMTFSNVTDNIDFLYGLYKTLRISRQKRGVMDFDRIESQILFDNKGKIKDIVASSRNDAHRLIEECMLMANQAAAKFLQKNNEDFLYRSHPKPTAEKVELTQKFLTAIGLTLEGGIEPESRNFAKVLKQAKGRDDENIIKTVVLRTMKQATYTPVNEGHFGLAFEDYAHFTSPIRRYPDLLVHRAIKRVLNTTSREPSGKMIEFGTHLSMTERRADDASRDVEQWLKCEYMRDKVGENFHGVISGVAGFGLFVELSEVYVEGLVSIRDLKDDYFIFDDVHHQLKGQRGGKIYRLGDMIKVKVASVNLDDRKIDFIPDFG
ncbi:ribonuclease R [Candidatus Thioglobus sp. NP1]|uniref:ribonuclease R n=1 Tax=Candidatus Thioglobus sp. NP1 TaxID=2508687 RepID=UPI000DEE07D6|nr:ribonuclease R [Candidatus Thioglobus sp. NP1]AXE62278.1 ribonuclease R [Candidatus Thioglobus sp. NP1]